MSGLSLRWRLALTLGLLILLIAAAMSIYLPKKIEDEAIALVSHQAETLAQLTAFTIHPSVHFRDPAALEEALRGTRQDRDVAYVLVVDAKGKELASFHRQRASAPALARRVRGGALASDRDLYEVMTPMVEEGEEIARLYIGLSLARVQQEIRETRLAVGALMLIVLSAALLAVIIISNLMTRPLRRLAGAAQGIAAGDLDQRVPSGRGDEIGLLADAFNDMAARIAERDARLRGLSRRLLSVQEEERIRIAREVHDELGQALTALKIDLQQAGRDHRVTGEPLNAIAQKIDQIVELVRRIASDLRPAILDDLGLAAALEKQLRRVRESTGIQTTLTAGDEPALDMLSGATLYRIAQEALANVVRHSGASRVDLSLETGDATATLVIRDNGRGMTREQATGPESLGILGIRERAELLGGVVAIESEPGQGTTVSVTLPLKKDAT